MTERESPCEARELVRELQEKHEEAQAEYLAAWRRVRRIEQELDDAQDALEALIEGQIE